MQWSENHILKSCPRCLTTYLAFACVAVVPEAFSLLVDLPLVLTDRVWNSKPLLLYWRHRIWNSITTFTVLADRIWKSLVMEDKIKTLLFLVFVCNSTTPTGKHHLECECDIVQHLELTDRVWNYTKFCSGQQDSIHYNHMYSSDTRNIIDFQHECTAYCIGNIHHSLCRWERSEKVITDFVSKPLLTIYEVCW